jgi:hypothetical protein
VLCSWDIGSSAMESSKSAIWILGCMVAWLTTWPARLQLAMFGFRFEAELAGTYSERWEGVICIAS